MNISVVTRTAGVRHMNRNAGRSDGLASRTGRGAANAIHPSATHVIESPIAEGGARPQQRERTVAQQPEVSAHVDHPWACQRCIAA